MSLFSGQNSPSSEYIFPNGGDNDVIERGRIPDQEHVLSSRRICPLTKLQRSALANHKKPLWDCATLCITRKELSALYG